MKRTDFAKVLISAGLCPLFIHEISAANPTASAKTMKAIPSEEASFIENWLTDLLDTMEKELDRETCVRLMEGCGHGCFRRHEFKINLARKGKDDIDNLLKAYSEFFEVWRAEDGIHIRFGEVSERCYCPVVQNIPPKENDLHCECQKATHEAIFEAALGKKTKVNILETLRRGGKTCHFLVDACDLEV